MGQGQVARICTDYNSTQYRTLPILVALFIACVTNFGNTSWGVIPISISSVTNLCTEQYLYLIPLNC